MGILKYHCVKAGEFPAPRLVLFPACCYGCTCLSWPLPTMEVLVCGVLRGEQSDFPGGDLGCCSCGPDIQYCLYGGCRYG